MTTVERQSFALSVAAVVAATALTVALVHPMGPDWWGEPAGIWTAIGFAWGAGAAQFVVTTCCQAFLTRQLALVATFSLLPIAVAVWGSTLRDNHERWDRSGAIFASYTASFPEGRLGAPYLLDGVGPLTAVCAQEGEPDRYDEANALCIELDLRERAGREVYGGFRTVVGAESWESHGCWGSPLRCNE